MKLSSVIAPGIHCVLLDYFGHENRRAFEVFPLAFPTIEALTPAENRHSDTYSDTEEMVIGWVWTLCTYGESNWTKVLCSASPHSNGILCQLRP